MVEVDKLLFILMCIFAGVGALITLFFILYIIAAILDYAHMKYKEKNTEKYECPEKIEDEDF